MRDPIVIVGAGASAVHAAQTVLEAGRRVTMLDVGSVGGPPMLPRASLNQLKDELDDPIAYFLGNDFSALVLPSDSSEYYGLPPSKAYVFDGAPGFDVAAHGIAPMWSNASGGLAQAWTAGAYPFSDGELDAFPFGWDDIAPSYGEVARRIGISGSVADDLAPFMPGHDAIQPPIALDAHSRQLLDRYELQRGRLSAKHGLFLGRARIASLSEAQNDRPACSLCGRCLWGCPTQSIYTPSVTLARLMQLPDFTYRSRMRVERFEFDNANAVTRLVVRHADSGQEETVEVGTLVLGAGALGSAAILLRSLQHSGERVELRGLMDNRQVLMPFVNLARIGKGFDDRSYQYNQLAIGAPGARPFDYVHGLMTTLTTALIHPVAQSLPSGMRTAARVFRNIHGALGLVNINFPDTRRDENVVALDTAGRLHIRYCPDAGEKARVAAANAKFRAFLLGLGCVAPSSMTRLRPMGASVHYAGLTPMQHQGGDLTTDPLGRCRPFQNLVIVDGATFPALPAKNLTFTLMANATRIMRGILAA